MTPLDVVKVRLQAQNIAASNGKPCTVIMRDELMDFPCVCMPEPKSEFKGTLVCAKLQANPVIRELINLLYFILSQRISLV